ncbi:AaceriAFR374Cp [[Ashbya] aceris (nom. inval.)]|nr:AaceriAFR374Cp [[Ashbya] aceris (nom. inval.)]
MADEHEAGGVPGASGDAVLPARDVPADQDVGPVLAASGVGGERVNITETVGGTATRRYLNEHVTGVLLQGMRQIAVEKPADPLRALGEFLLAESERRRSK